MVKRLKLRLSRVISSLHSSCRSKDPSNLPETPVPPLSFFMLSPVNPKARDIDFPVPPPPKSQSQSQSQSHHKRHLSPSILCGCRPKPGSSYSPSLDTIGSSPDEFHWKQDAKWHVVARVQQQEQKEEPPRRKLYNSSVSDESEGGTPPCLPPEKKKKKLKTKKKKTKKKNLKCSRGRFSNSSADSGWFSSEAGVGEEEEENETETLVSSSRTFSSSCRTFSTDSSTDFDTYHLETIRENTTTAADSNSRRKKKKKKKKKRKRKNVKMVKQVKEGCPLKRCSPTTGKISACGSSESESPARFSSVFKRFMPCKVEGKVKESFAVVKKSEDPYEDFKRSMLEMIVANQMFDRRDLEQLLHCFLSLNSKHHHADIVEAFSDVWEILFRKSSSSPLN